MKRIHASIGPMLFVAWGFLMPNISLNAGQIQARVAWREGTVEEVRAGRVRALQREDFVKPGAKIQTGTEGALLLEFFPRTLVLVRPNTELQIKALASDSLSEGGLLFDQASLELLRGQLFANVRKIEGRVAAVIVEAAGRRLYTEKGLYSVTRREGALSIAVGRDEAIWQGGGSEGVGREVYLRAGQLLRFGEQGQKAKLFSTSLVRDPLVRPASLTDVVQELTPLQGWMSLLGVFDTLSIGTAATQGGDFHSLMGEFNATVSEIDSSVNGRDPRGGRLSGGIRQRLLAIIRQLVALLALLPPNSPLAQLLREIIQELQQQITQF